MDETTELPEQKTEKTRDEILFDLVVERLRMIFDPEIPVNIYELGLIYGIKTSEEGEVAIEMTLTSPNCPVAEELPNSVHSNVMSIDVVTKCTVELVWEPPWDHSRMSDEAKVQLDMFY